MRHALAALAFMLAVQAANAAPHVWTEPHERFTVTIPDGWKIYTAPASKGTKDLLSIQPPDYAKVPGAPDCSVSVDEGTKLAAPDQAAANRELAPWTQEAMVDRLKEIGAADIKVIAFLNALNKGVRVVQIKLDETVNKAPTRMLRAQFLLARPGAESWLYTQACWVDPPYRDSDLAALHLFMSSLTFVGPNKP